MFGFFKKRQPQDTPPTPRASPPPLPASASDPLENHWDEMGMCKLVPDYIQRHLASRNPQHALRRRADGSIEFGNVPPLIVSEARIRAEITRRMRAQIPPDEPSLSVLSSEEIVSRLCTILTESTGNSDYAAVCKMWCTAMKLG
jgi:hypothetical protein